MMIYLNDRYCIGPPMCGCHVKKKWKKNIVNIPYSNILIDKTTHYSLSVMRVIKMHVTTLRMLVNTSPLL